MTEHDQEEQRAPDQEPRTSDHDLDCPYAGSGDRCACGKEPRTGGVAVWRSRIDLNDWTEAEPMGRLRRDYERGTWFPLAEAEALLGKSRDRDEWKASRELQKACADALRARAESLIDPNDPAVRERVVESIKPWMSRDEKADAVLAALRSKP